MHKDENKLTDDENKMESNKRKREEEEDDQSSESEGEGSDNGEETDYDSEEGSESESDSQEESESDGNEEVPSSSKTKSSNTLGILEIDSDGSSGSSDHKESCAICLGCMKGEIGSPELCDHSFCLECILEWAKTNNSCPQDRTQFLQVFVRKKVKGKIVRTITVAEVKPDDIPPDEDDEPVFCEVCGRCDREDTLLLCDGCDSGHHLECLSPPLSSVPIEEWFCSECQAVNRGQTTTQEDCIGVEEITTLIDDAGPDTHVPPSSSHRSALRLVPRTRASERVRRRISRARNFRRENGQSSSYSESESEETEADEDFDECIEEEEIGVTSTTTTIRTKSTSSKVAPPAQKKRKIVIKRKRKVKRKTTKRKSVKRKTTTARKRKTGRRKRKTTKSATKKKGGKRKTTKKRRSAKGKKKKGKKKPAPQAIITPKARLAEALGIRPMKNPWQLSLPAMSGGSRSQEGTTLTNQRWRAGVPSLSLLGSNSELDYVSEPDEFGDAILAAGVARRHHAISETSIARRKSLAAKILARPSSCTERDMPQSPLCDTNSNNVSDILSDIIHSQSQLLTHAKNSTKDVVKSSVDSPLQNKNENLSKQRGVGSNSPKQDDNANKPPSNNSPRTSQQPFFYGVIPCAKTSDNSSAGLLIPRNSSNGDPTGSKAYSSYLKEQSHSDNVPESSSNKGEKKNKKDDKKRDDDDINLYSDIEPEHTEEPEEEEDESDNEGEAENENEKNQEHPEENDSPLSGDELVIDDSVRQEAKEKVGGGEPQATLNSSGSTNNENEVGSSNLPGLNDFELEAVSDADTHEMDKSMNSSISLSDSNMGDAEVTSSTNELNVKENDPKDHRRVQMYSRPVQNRFNSPESGPVGMGLEGLETETISDNEEICFENFGNEDDNIEEGEIPSENQPRALPANRPKINIQLRRVIEVTSPNKEFDGECEEGEIVDESAAKREKKREKAKREVEEVVNPSPEEPTEEVNKENVNPEPNPSLTTLIVEPDLSSPEKTNPSDKTAKVKEKREKVLEKEKEKEKPKEKDVSFKKVSRNTKIRNYRDNDKDMRGRRRGSRERSHSKERLHNRVRGHSRERDHSKDRSRNRERNREGGRGGGMDERYRRRGERERKKEPKRKEMERYNVRQMINKKEEERKKKDEFGRDVSLRGVRPSRSRSRSKSSRSRSKNRGRRRRSTSKKRSSGAARNRSGRALRKSLSRSRSKSHPMGRSRRKRRSSYSSSSSSSSSSSTSSSSSSYSSSSSSSRSRSRSRRPRERKRLTKSRSKSLSKKVVEKKKTLIKPKEKLKKVVIPTQKKKDEKKEKKKKDKEEEMKPEKQKKKRKRDKTPLQSKEVYQAGGSIMVSVNFSRNKDGKEVRKKKSDKELKPDDPKKKRKQPPEKGTANSFHSWSPGPRSTSPGGKHTPLQDEPMWSPENLHPHPDRAAETAKTPEVVDLDIIMVTPPPDEPILISDSEEEEEEEEGGGITRLPPDLGAQQRSPISRSQGGPKTPPEPGVKFTLSTKQVLKPINNPLRDEEEEDRSVPVPSRGPNTPPGPPPESDESVGRPKSPVRRIPRSPVGTPPTSSPEPDVYDPFEPTKSPSPPTRSPQQEARVSSSDQTDQNMIKSPAAVSPTKKLPSPPPPPPLPTDPPQKEERPPEPQKPPEDEATSTAMPPAASTTIPTPPTAPTLPPPHSVAPSSQTVTSLPGIIALSSATHTLPQITAPTNTQPLNSMQQLFAGLPANVANILYPAALAAAAMRGATNSLLRPPGNQPLLPPDFSRPPPTTAIINRPPPISPMKVDKSKATQNGQNMGDMLDLDAGSPTSPDSSDVSDIFEPPSPHATAVPEKTSPRKPRATSNQKPSPVKANKHMDKFDALFGSGGDSRTPTKPSHKMKSGGGFNSKLNKIKNLGKKLENEDDIPSSAVDLQVKEKLLKKVQRQERVVDEVKLCLKPFYNKKTISKDDYKDIMKKCVQKVCHNKSGEINPNKIRGLVEGYIKKVKYYRKKQGGGGGGGGTGGVATGPSGGGVGGTAGILSQLKGGGGGPVLPPTANDPPPPGFAMKAHMKLKP